MLLRSDAGDPGTPPFSQRQVAGFLIPFLQCSKEEAGQVPLVLLDKSSAYSALSNIRYGFCGLSQQVSAMPTNPNNLRE